MEKNNAEYQEKNVECANNEEQRVRILTSNINEKSVEQIAKKIILSVKNNPKSVLLSNRILRPN